MKSTPERFRASSARGCRIAVGFGLSSAASMPGECANVSATATERLRASRSLSDRDCRTSAPMPAATSNTTIATCRRKT